MRNYPIFTGPAPGYKEVMKRKQVAKKWKHERKVRFGAVLPVSVELVVGTNEDDPDENSDWEVLSVRSANCDATPRTVMENMGEEDFAELARVAAAAEDSE